MYDGLCFWQSMAGKTLTSENKNIYIYWEEFLTVLSPSTKLTLYIVCESNVIPLG